MYKDSEALLPDTLLIRSRLFCIYPSLFVIRNLQLSAECTNRQNYKNRKNTNTMV